MRSNIRGITMKIIVTDMEEVVNLKPCRPALLISIATPTLDHPSIDKDRWDCILRLKFFDDDGDYESSGYSFNEDHGIAIKTTVEECEWNTIYIQCEAGLSRSPAIGHALKRYYGIKTAKISRGPFESNRHIYLKMLEILSGSRLAEPNDVCSRCSHTLCEHGVFFHLMKHEIDQRTKCRIDNCDCNEFIPREEDLHGNNLKYDNRALYMKRGREP